MRLLNLGVLPPLRYLLLSGVQDPAWVLLLSCRSDTLIELIIHNCQQPPFSSIIHLPNIQHLTISDSPPSILASLLCARVWPLQI